MQKRPWFISAGEYSGDLLAADLVKALRLKGFKMPFLGVAGKSMIQSGVKPLAKVEELSVMGLWEVLAKLGDLAKLQKAILNRVDQEKVPVVILVDFPEFHLRLGQQLRLRGVKVIQYVAPKLWAWGAERASRLKESYDLLLGVLPFEKEFFSNLNIPYTYVGSPHKERIDKFLDEQKFAVEKPQEKIVSCFLGSRLDEVKRMLPVFRRIILLLQKKMPQVKIVFPIAANLDLSQIRSLAQAYQLRENNNLCFVHGESLDSMAKSSLAIVTSGTATLECALVRTPLIVVYRMNDLSYDIAIKKVKVLWISLVNLILKRKAVSEYIQHFKEDEIVDEALELISPSKKQKKMLDDFELLREILLGGGSHQAAKKIQNFIHPEAI